MFLLPVPEYDIVVYKNPPYRRVGRRGSMRVLDASS